MWFCPKCRIHFGHEPLEAHLYRNHVLPIISEDLGDNHQQPKSADVVYTCGDCDYQAVGGFEDIGKHCLRYGHDPITVQKGPQLEDYASQLFLTLADIIFLSEDDNNNHNNGNSLEMDEEIITHPSSSIFDKGQYSKAAGFHHEKSPNQTRNSQKISKRLKRSKIRLPEMSADSMSVKLGESSSADIVCRKLSKTTTPHSKKKKNQTKTTSPKNLSPIVNPRLTWTAEQSFVSSTPPFQNSNLEQSSLQQLADADEGHPDDSSAARNLADNTVQAEKEMVSPGEGPNSMANPMPQESERYERYETGATDGTDDQKPIIGESEKAIRVPNNDDEENRDLNQRNTSNSASTKTTTIMTTNDAGSSSSDVQVYCQHCGKLYTNRSAYRSHVQYHSLERARHCPNCPDRLFKSRSDLNRHLRVHNNEKPFACQFCNRRTRCAADLKKHVRIHTNERPYKCTICGFAFAQSTSLTLHMDTHSYEKQYPCTHCGKEYRQAFTLKYHIRDVHPEAQQNTSPTASGASSQMSFINDDMTAD